MLVLLAEKVSVRCLLFEPELAHTSGGNIDMLVYSYFVIHVFVQRAVQLPRVFFTFYYEAFEQEGSFMT